MKNQKLFMDIYNRITPFIPQLEEIMKEKYTNREIEQIVKEIISTIKRLKKGKLGHLVFDTPIIKFENNKIRVFTCPSSLL